MSTRTLVVAGLLVACGGDDPGTTPTPPEVAPTFTEVRDDILVPSCGLSTCHGAAAGGLQLDEATTAADLVDVDSALSPGDILVIANDPDNSYLMRKLEDDTSIVGQLMPPPFGGLEPERIEIIRAWIADGAPDN